MHPACPNKKQNHLQNSFLRRAQFWVRKTFSKPASLKRASLVREPSILHLPTSFPKQILTPSRFKLILLINNGIDWRDHNSCSFWAENFGRSLEGQGGPTRGSKVFNTIIQMEAGHLRENPQIPQQQETLQAITYKAAKGWCAFF